jgi:atypical dual specificity phosphatase
MRPMKSKSVMKNDIVLEFAAMMSRIGSPMIQLTYISSASIILTLTTGSKYCLLVPLTFFIFNYKKILFDFFLICHILQMGLTSWKWHTKVDDGLYLGAIPVLSHHQKEISERLKVAAVLSIVENFELRTSVVIGTPVRPEEWKRLDVAHLHLSSPDYIPPSLQLLDTGADWLNTQLSEGKNVYVHCKSGHGRSASIVMAYFMKYRRLGIDTAHKFLTDRRPSIFSKSSRQYRNMQAYERKLQGIKSGM